MPQPDDNKIFFCVCDDSRSEAGGKISLMGLLGDRIEIKEPAIPAGAQLMLPKLVLFLAITAGEGRFQMTGAITNPKGKKSDLGTVEVDKRRDGWANVALELSPFPVHDGEYVFDFALDGKAYRRSFRVALSGSH
jgi:hypothetical protein